MLTPAELSAHMNADMPTLQEAIDFLETGLTNSVLSKPSDYATFAALQTVLTAARVLVPSAVTLGRKSVVRIPVVRLNATEFNDPAKAADLLQKVHSKSRLK